MWEYLRKLLVRATGLCITVGVSCLICTFAPMAWSSGYFVNQGDILVANYGGHSVLLINPSNGNHRSLGTFASPTGVTMSAEGILYVSQWNGTIKRLDLNTGEITVVNSNTIMAQVWGLVLSSSGDLYAASRRSNSVFRISPQNGTESLITQAGLITDIRGIDLAGTGQAIVTSWSDSQLISVELSTGTQSVFAGGAQGIHQPWGIVRQGPYYYLGAYDTKILQRLSSGVVSTVASLPGFPLGLCMDLEGNVLVGCSGPNVIVRVTPFGAIQASFSGGLIKEVSGLNVSAIRVVPTITNTAPKLGAISNCIAIAGQLLSFRATATDEDLPAQTLAFSLEPGAPTGATISSSGLFSWRPTDSQAATTNAITVKVTDDGDPPLSSTASFSVLVDYSNLPPVLALIADQTVLAGDTLAFTVTATDPNITPQTLVFSLDPNVPEGVSISTNGDFLWHTLPSQEGSTNRIAVRVTDNGIPPRSALTNFNVGIHEVILQASVGVADPFTDDPTAAIDSTQKEVSVSWVVDTRFFRLRAAVPVRISGIRRDGSRVVLKYTAAAIP